MKKGFLLGICLFCCLVFVSAQEFQSLYSSLDELDRTLESLQNYINSQSMTLKDLQSKIEFSQTEANALRDISLTQGELLNGLYLKIQMQEQIRQEQLRYQRTLGNKLLIWKIGGCALGVTSAGLLIWVLVK